MKPYTFRTKISEKGLIQIPYHPALYDKEVEITIVPKQVEMKKDIKATDFVNKWAGFLDNLDPYEAKYKYLSEKYK